MSAHDPLDPAAARAVALRYRADAGRAPEIVAKGQAEVAERILACAREHGIPVREDRDLVELLAACDLGAEIPEELYGAVARLLSFLYRLNAAQGAATARRIAPEQGVAPEKGVTPEQGVAPEQADAAGAGAESARTAAGQ